VSPVKRDAYAEVLSKHYEIVKRGEFPGSGHFIERRAPDPSANSQPQTEGTLFGKTPTVSPAVALDEDGQDISIVSTMRFSNLVAYFSAIEIGSGKKQFLVVMDTGSSDLWVPAANCKSRACNVHKTLGSSDSSTLQVTNQPWQIQYGTGAAAGVVVADSLSIGGLQISRMPFGVATQLSNNFAQFVCLNNEIY